MDNNRETAYLTLYKVASEDAYSNIELNHQIQSRKPDQPAFVRELVYGVLRRTSRIDYALSQLITRGFRKLKPDILTILRMGVFQIAYMDSVPDYAAADESVRLAKKYCRGRDRFVNGVLRNYIRKQQELRKPEEIQDPCRRLSAVWSYDPSITRLWLRQFGEERTASIMEASDRVPDLTVCVNRQKCSTEDLKCQLEEKGYQVSAGRVSARILHVQGSGVLDTDLFREGAFFVQGEASAAAAEMLDPQPGDLLVDVCGAPGGKSMSAAELMENRGEIHSFDLYEHRVKLIGETARRLGFDIVHPGVHDAQEAEPSLLGRADRVICDVPCSGLGVVRKKPEIKFRKLTDNGAALADLQYNILEASSGYVRPGGSIIYSTCTISRTENEDVAARFLREHPEFQKVREKQFLPDEQDTDGFYCCVMRRDPSAAV